MKTQEFLKFTFGRHKRPLFGYYEPPNPRMWITLGGLVGANGVVLIAEPRLALSIWPRLYVYPTMVVAGFAGMMLGSFLWLCFHDLGKSKPDESDEPGSSLVR
jgi:hypothetical protein